MLSRNLITAGKFHGFLLAFCNEFGLSLLAVRELAVWLIDIYHLIMQHWVSNNLLGMALAFLGVELLHINTVTNGYILFIGFFIYEVVWVGTFDLHIFKR